MGNSAGGIFLYKNCGEYPDRPRYFERRDHADRNLIEGNTFLGGRNGVWVGSRMAENTLPMDCTDPAYVDQPARRVVLDHAADNVVRGNAFYDVTYGVRVEDDRTTVEGNTFAGSGPDRHAVIIGTPDRTDRAGPAGGRHRPAGQRVHHRRQPGPLPGDPRPGGHRRRRQPGPRRADAPCATASRCPASSSSS